MLFLLSSSSSLLLSSLLLFLSSLSQTSIHRLETALGWASAEPIAFVMLMSLSRCTARHSGACRCAPIDFAYPRGSRFQPKQGSDSSRRARDTAATMLHFTHFWRHRGESAMKHCQLYNCTCKKCVYMNISDKNWPNNVEFRVNFHRYAPSTAGSQEIILTVELSNPKSTRATDWQIHATYIICVCSQNCGLLSTHNLLIIHMNECTCTEFLWHFFQASNLMPKLGGQNHARISPMLATSARFQSHWHIMTCNYLLNFGHRRLVYISSATADGSLPSPSRPPVKVALDISGAPLKTNGAPGNI